MRSTTGPSAHSPRSRAMKVKGRELSPPALTVCLSPRGSGDSTTAGSASKSVKRSVRDAVERFKAYTAKIEADGLATTHLVAPFFRTVIGTDTYTDQLW